MTADAGSGDGPRARADAGGVAAPEGPWTVLRLIRWSAEYLTAKGVEPAQARLDAEHLLASALETSRLQLYLQFDRPLTPEELARYKPLLLRRAAREPLQYILERAAFRELDLRVDPRVLIPRPETEELVEAVLEWARARTGAGRPRSEGGSDAASRTLSALDVGTGSGCIALSLAQEGPFGRVVAVDASPAALQVARENARDAGLEERVDFLEGELLTPVRGERFDVLVSNPPYVAEEDRESLAPEVRDHEPGGALFAGRGGMDVIAPLVAGAPDALAPGGLLALEVGLGQAPDVADRIRATGAFREPRVRRDLSGRPRMVLSERRGDADAGPGDASGGSQP